MHGRPLSAHVRPSWRRCQTRRHGPPPPATSKGATKIGDIRDAEEKLLPRARVDVAFDAPEPDWQLQVDAGDIVEILDRPTPGWWTVRELFGTRNAGEDGDVPAAFLTELVTNHHTSNDESDDD